MSIEHDVGARGARAARGSARRRLSRRQAREIARIGQWWEEVLSGESWRIRQLHRADGGPRESSTPLLAPVLLERPGEGRRGVTYGELGAGYRLIDEDSVG